MTVQIALRLDDRLAESARTAAARTGTNLSEWIRQAIRREAAAVMALQARAEEDARQALYTPGQEDTLMAARQARAVASFQNQG